MSRLALVRWIDLPFFRDERGTLTVIEGDSTIPFEIKRIYFVHSIKADRAGHAHRDTQQIMIGLVGALDVVLSDGTDVQSFRLAGTEKGLYVPPLLFIRLTRISGDAVLLVLASTHYDKSRSIRSWQEYLTVVAK